METLQTLAELKSALAGAIRQHRRLDLLLDYDGTLAPFHEDRMLALPYVFVPPRLERLSQFPSTRVVLVSGRPLNELFTLLAPPKGTMAFGCHGREYVNSAGIRELLQPDTKSRRGLDEAKRILTQRLPDCSLEEKTGSLALHWRGLPDGEIAGLANDVKKLWEPIASAHGLELLYFDGGIEIRAPGCTKANAVHRLRDMQHERAPAVYLGDDLTDEDAFAALGEGDFGILVRREPRNTAARYWISTPQDVDDVLSVCINVLEEFHP